MIDIMEYDMDPNCIPSINVLTSSYNHNQNRLNTAAPPIQKVRKTRTPKTASGKNSRLATSAAMERDKRSSQLKSYGYLSAPQPAQVARRNERERNRVKQVNMGFAKLRQYVPSGNANKKLSKVETLRSAVEYIQGMAKLLGDPSMDISLNAFIKMTGEKDVGCAPEDRSMTAKNEPHASTSVLHCMNNFSTGCISSESGHLLDQAASASVPAQSDFDFLKIEDNSDDFSWYMPQ